MYFATHNKSRKEFGTKNKQQQSIKLHKIQLFVNYFFLCKQFCGLTIFKKDFFKKKFYCLLAARKEISLTFCFIMWHIHTHAHEDGLRN